MKKLTALFLCIVLTMTLAACGDNAPSAVTTTTTADTATTTTENVDVTTTTDTGDDVTTTTVAATTTATQKPTAATTTKKPTTTSTKATTTTTTRGRAEINGNVWTLDYKDIDGVVYAYVMDLKTNQLRSLACIPWDEAFSAANWQQVKQHEPESVYVYGGGEYYVDASATYPLTVNHTVDTATVLYTRADNAEVRMTVTRSGGLSLQVVEDTAPTGSLVGKTFYCK